MENFETIYKPEKEKERLVLTKEQKNAIRNITLGIEEVDETIREMAMDDVAETLENGHPLNRLITDKEGRLVGYVACEDFVQGEAYIKYFGASEGTGRNAFQELPVFFEYAKQKGYSKINFHGWNERLNRTLEHFGFRKLRTDAAGGFSADFYEKILREQKTSGAVSEERKKAFEQKYINKIKKEYEQTLKKFSDDTRQEKERKIKESLNVLGGRISGAEGIEFGERQKEILKLKLTRHFQNNETCDLNSLYDAIIETPKFINTDKGSLHRLLEVHEQKTLEQIAQMRKRRAEIGHNETFNPYEALLRTDSGKYYLAKLLNMPHLEEESEYMSHCVGTSDSYINRMKRGEIEILSLRRTKESGSTEADMPIITIEYDPKAKVIIQMKKADDEYLSKNDPYFDDVINAFKKLRQTKTDIGETRDFKKISESELENIEAQDYHLLTEAGEIHFRDFDPNEETFVLKTGKMEITPEMSHEDAVKIIQIIEDITVEPEEIARKRDEINEKTKIYIGSLFKGIFESDIENIYASFPEGKIEQGKIEIGGMAEEDLERAIKNRKDEQDGDYQISSYAKSMMKHKDFAASVQERLKNPETIDLVRLKVKDLGFTENPTTDELYKRAEGLGLELCPPETGPHLRLKYEEVFKREQPMYEYLRIAMKQIAGSRGDLHVFSVGRYDGGFWLDDRWTHPSSRWGLGGEFVFRLRKET